MRKKVVIAIIAVCLVIATVLLVLFLLSERIWVRTFIYEPEMLWNEHEAFVIIGSGTQRISLSRYQEIMLQLGGSREIHSTTPAEYNTTVYHISKNGIEKRQINGHKAGGMFLANGSLHQLRGGSPRRAWRWNGTEFDELDNKDTEQLGEELRLARMKREGWNEYLHLNSFQGEQKDYVIQIDNRKAILRVVKDDVRSAGRYIIMMPPQNESMLLEEHHDLWSPAY